ncbi:NAD(P)-binding protein [Microthyrium microscopicum]|uniref:NAD(P)-binding protein n=1 Tax=Microthyrium microscopicum TaxID=703497 RepID=A0A6A6UM59_9PEZI|nr:NAD(P)-binding protein [Microthyrium microscopicum]
MTVDTLSLAGKVAIVTGSGRENGIGAYIAYALARNGAAVTLNYVSDSSAPRAAIVGKRIQDAGGRATVVQASVGVEEDSKRLVSETLKAFNVDHIDILVNNAGVLNVHTSLDVTKEAADEILNVNILGPILLTQAVIPHMPPGGRIINISSAASKMGMPIAPVYGASKAALDSLTYVWAQEFGRSKGITVNSIAPGPVHTDIQGDHAEEAKNFAMGFIRAAERIGTTDDIADAVLLIVNEKSRWITGQYISVSGGMTGQ